MKNETEELDKLIGLYGNSIEGKIWRGSRLNTIKKGNNESIDTGYESINKQLHSNGWPIGSINEFGINEYGIGELRLLIPALKGIQKPPSFDPKYSQKNSPQVKGIVLIAPPYLPFAPALAKEGIDLGSLTVVQTTSLKDSLWAAEQSLTANCCAAVICWTGTHKIDNHDLRRLQLASEKTRSWSVLFRHSRCLEEPSASALRVQLSCNSYSTLELNILKQPQGWGGQKSIVSLAPHYENWQRLPANLLPVHHSSNSLFQDQLKNHKAAELPMVAKTNNIMRPESWHSSVTVIAALSELKTVH